MYVHTEVFAHPAVWFSWRSPEGVIMPLTGEISAAYLSAGDPQGPATLPYGRRTTRTPWRRGGYGSAVRGERTRRRTRPNRFKRPDR